MATITASEERSGHPYLDDPIAFAHELYSLLAAGGDRRLLIANPTAYKAFDGAVNVLQAAVLSDQPVDERLVCEVDALAYELATDQHSVGVEFGVAAEQLRRSLLDGANGPRIPWRPVVQRPAPATPVPASAAD